MSATAIAHGSCYCYALSGQADGLQYLTQLAAEAGTCSLSFLSQ